MLPGYMSLSFRGTALIDIPDGGNIPNYGPSEVYELVYAVSTLCLPTRCGRVKSRVATRVVCGVQMLKGCLHSMSTG